MRARYSTYCLSAYGAVCLSISLDPGAFLICDDVTLTLACCPGVSLLFARFASAGARWQRQGLAPGSRRRGPTSRRTLPAGCSVSSRPAWTGPASPPCARSGAPPRGSSPCPHRSRCWRSRTAPSTASPTASPSDSLASAALATRPPPVAAGSSSRAMTAASWWTPSLEPQ